MTKKATWYVYGYTDRHCGVGFPASEKAFDIKAAAEKHLKTIGRKGFKFKNKKGNLGWVQKD